MERADGLVVQVCESIERRLHHGNLGVGGGGRPARHSPRSARVAQSAGLAVVIFIAKVSDNMHHAAAVRLREMSHLLRLREPVRDLRLVRRGPGVVAQTDGFVGVDERAAVDPQLFQRAVE